MAAAQRRSPGNASENFNGILSKRFGSLLMLLKLQCDFDWETASYTSKEGRLLLLVRIAAVTVCHSTVPVAVRAVCLSGV